MAALNAIYTGVVLQRQMSLMINNLQGDTMRFLAAERGIGNVPTSDEIGGGSIIAKAFFAQAPMTHTLWYGIQFSLLNVTKFR